MCYALLPVQHIDTPIEANGSLICFFDGGFNVSIVQKAWTRSAGLQGSPVTCTVHVAGGHSKNWKTHLYNGLLVKNDGTIVKILAMGIAKISESLKAVDHKSIV